MVCRSEWGAAISDCLVDILFTVALYPIRSELQEVILTLVTTTRAWSLLGGQSVLYTCSYMSMEPTWAWSLLGGQSVLYTCSYMSMEPTWWTVCVVYL